ncbi:hypothetical protein FRC00_010784 [Tulasnella sp. 408]|nr:hypothetical protein FRC00_010784 [Tulasnella sp. 408]
MLNLRSIRPVTASLRNYKPALSTTGRRTVTGVYDAVPPPGGPTTSSDDPASTNTSSGSNTSAIPPSETFPGPDIPPPPINPDTTTPSAPDGVSGVPATTGKGQQNGESMAHVIPFNTYEFYKALEQSFEPPVARTLMRATREMLVGRIRKTTTETLHVKDFDNGAYLFKAALSELRTELTLRTRKETATLRTSLNALKKEVDLLDGKMKEDIANLKHEIQIDINNRKTESKAETKARDIDIEVRFSGDFLPSIPMNIILEDFSPQDNRANRTEIEQAKWDNTRRGVIIILALVGVIIVSFELAPKKPPPPPPPPPAPIMIERPLPSVREMEGEDSSSSAS